MADRGLPAGLYQTRGGLVQLARIKKHAVMIDLLIGQAATSVSPGQSDNTRCWVDRYGCEYNYRCRLIRRYVDGIAPGLIPYHRSRSGRVWLHRYKYQVCSYKQCRFFRDADWTYQSQSWEIPLSETSYAAWEATRMHCRWPLRQTHVFLKTYRPQGHFQEH